MTHEDCGMSIKTKRGETYESVRQTKKRKRKKKEKETFLSRMHNNAKLVSRLVVNNEKRFIHSSKPIGTEEEDKRSKRKRKNEKEKEGNWNKKKKIIIIIKIENASGQTRGFSISHEDFQFIFCEIVYFHINRCFMNYSFLK